MMFKSDKKPAFTILFFAILIATAAMLNQGFRSLGTKKSHELSGNSISYNKSYKIPDNVTFAGERMPVENFDTRESLERELIISAYRHSSTILIIKRAHRYLPEIEKILRENHIPDDFKYLAAAESEYSNMVSPVGATGFWQILAGTGKEAGMEINNVVDERYDVAKSTQFACDYFLKSFEKYGNWTLTAASYNGGRAALEEQIKIQKENDYYNLLLSDETARYIFRAVAYKLIINDPNGYGFNLDSTDMYMPLKYYEVKVDTAITDFSDFAKDHGTNYKLLKYLNPWLRKPFLTPRPGKEYLIKIPSEGMRLFGNTFSDN
jgi:hypothetical protein